jgi:hypothetical protein
MRIVKQSLRGGGVVLLARFHLYCGKPSVFKVALHVCVLLALILLSGVYAD